jgi:hypothetical protein
VTKCCRLVFVTFKSQSFSRSGQRVCHVQVKEFVTFKSKSLSRSSQRVCHVKVKEVYVIYYFCNNRSRSVPNFYHFTFVVKVCSNSIRQGKLPNLPTTVSIVTGYGLEGRGKIPNRPKIFLFYTASRPALGSTKAPIQWVPGAISRGRGVKLPPGHEADHSPASSAEVTIGGAMLPFPLMSSGLSAFLIKHVDHFTLYLQQRASDSTFNPLSIYFGSCFIFLSIFEKENSCYRSVS